MLRVRKIVEKEIIKQNCVADLPRNFELKRSDSFDNLYHLYNFEELKNYGFVAIDINKSKDEFFLSSYNITAEKSKGYGSMLMKFIIAKAYKENIKKIRLEVIRNNYIAMKLYAKFNFVEKTEVYKRTDFTATLTLTL